MLLPLVLVAQSFLGVSVTCTDGRPCSLTITLSATIISASTLSMNTTPLDMEDAYAMTVETIYTGSEDAKSMKERFIVINASSGVVVANNEGNIGISTSMDALVLAWPEGYKLPGRKGLMAIAAAYGKGVIKGIYVAERIQRRLRIDKAKA